MATRPVFTPQPQGKLLVQRTNISFAWFAGFAISQKQKSITSQHQAIAQQLAINNCLEISSKSPDCIGVKASAFNLQIQTPTQTSITVECAFQGSKVFTNGGPFQDLYNKSPKEAKQDPRIKNSGQLTGFIFYEQAWPTEPKTLFYDWLYLNALQQNSTLAEQLIHYAAFTDIEFNPNKSINCQAYTAALFVALTTRKLLTEALSSPYHYQQVINSFQQK